MARQVSASALCVPSQYVIKVFYSFFQINLIRESLDFFLDALRLYIVRKYMFNESCYDGLHQDG